MSSTLFGWVEDGAGKDGKNGASPKSMVVLSPSPTQYILQTTLTNGKTINCNLPESFGSVDYTLGSSEINRVVVTDETKSLVSSSVTASELGRLIGITVNVQDKFDIIEYDLAGLHNLFGLVNPNMVLVSDGDSKIVSHESITSTELNYLSGLQENVQLALTNGGEAILALAGKFGTIGTNMALVSDGEGKIISHATVSATELGYLNGARSNLQDQIDLLEGGGGGGDIPIDMTAGKVVYATSTSTINTLSAIGFNGDDEIIELSEKTHIFGEDESDKFVIRDSDDDTLIKANTTDMHIDCYGKLEIHPNATESAEFRINDGTYDRFIVNTTDPRVYSYCDLVIHGGGLHVGGDDKEEMVLISDAGNVSMFQVDTVNNLVYACYDELADDGSYVQTVGMQTLAIADASEGQYVLNRADAFVVSTDPSSTSVNSFVMDTREDKDGALKINNGSLVLGGTNRDEKLVVKDNSGTNVLALTTVNNTLTLNGSTQCVGTTSVSKFRVLDPDNEVVFGVDTTNKQLYGEAVYPYLVRQNHFPVGTVLPPDSNNDLFLEYVFNEPRLLLSITALYNGIEFPANVKDEEDRGIYYFTYLFRDFGYKLNVYPSAELVQETTKSLYPVQFHGTEFGDLQETPPDSTTDYRTYVYGMSSDSDGNPIGTYRIQLTGQTYFYVGTYTFAPHLYCPESGLIRLIWKLYYADDTSGTNRVDIINVTFWEGAKVIDVPVNGFVTLTYNLTSPVIVPAGKYLTLYVGAFPD